MSPFRKLAKGPDPVAKQCRRSKISLSSLHSFVETYKPGLLAGIAPLLTSRANDTEMCVPGGRLHMDGLISY
jgi:hypothetical protein